MIQDRTPYYYYENRLKPPKDFYEWCYKQIRTYVWENKRQKIVASHRKHQQIIKKRLAKNSCLSFYDCSNYFDIVLCTSKRIERQTYKVLSYFQHGKQYFDCHLINLHMYRENEIQTIHRINEKRYDWGKTPIVEGMWGYSPSVYGNNIIERLERVSELKYCNLKEITVDNLYFYYKYKERLEYIQKIKAYGIEEQVISGRIDFRRLTMKFLTKWKFFLKNSYRTMADIQLKLEIELRGGKYIEGSELVLTASNVLMLDPRIPIVKLQNYLLKQDRSFVFSYYNDYFEMLKQLNIPITKNTMFPKDLTKAHDRAVDTLNELRLEVENKAFEKRYNEIKSMEKTVQGISFVVPKKASELIKEGRELNHCVGGSHYIKKHAEKKLTIVFVRKKTEPTKAYFTLELRENKVVQLYGYKNTDPSNELQAIVQEWLSSITRTNRKEKKVA